MSGTVGTILTEWEWRVRSHLSAVMVDWGCDRNNVWYARVNRTYRNLNLPNQEQSDTAIFLCQLLSNLYQPINVFRYDQKLKTLYIQAGVADGIAIVIDEDGNWNFVL